MAPIRRRVVEHRASIVTLQRLGLWREWVDEGLRKTFELVGDAAGEIMAIVLLGAGNANASAEAWAVT